MRILVFAPNLGIITFLELLRLVTLQQEDQQYVTTVIGTSDRFLLEAIGNLVLGMLGVCRKLRVLFLDAIPC